MEPYESDIDGFPCVLLTAGDQESCQTNATHRVVQSGIKNLRLTS
jgi:hypothetical protein